MDSQKSAPGKSTPGDSQTSAGGKKADGENDNWSENGLTAESTAAVAADEPLRISETNSTVDSEETGSSSPDVRDDSDISLPDPQNNEPADDLPATVTVLPAPCNGKVYLVGTAHFSRESNRDVEETIRKTKPNVVVVELCESRVAILALDEKTILEDSQNLNLEQIRNNMQKMGFVQGVMYSLLLSLSAQLTRELGMAPGGEFRAAFSEAKKIPGCVIQLGDRPVHITLRRAISSLSPWQKVKMAFSIIFSRETVTKEEVEKCKQRDLLESMLREITGEYPELSKVLVEERDMYLAYSLQLAATPLIDVRDGVTRLPATVVGVVGIGHVAGIVQNWGHVRDEDIPPLLHIPPQSLFSYVLIKSLKYSAVAAFAYGFYRFLLPKSVKSFFRR